MNTARTGPPVHPPRLAVQLVSTVAPQSCAEPREPGVGQQQFGDRTPEFGGEIQRFQREFEAVKADNSPQSDSFFDKVKSFWDGMTR